MGLFVVSRDAATGLSGGACDPCGWVPYVVAATESAVALGAILVTRVAWGPAGAFSLVRECTGVVIALWQRPQ